MISRRYVLRAGLTACGCLGVGSAALGGMVPDESIDAPTNVKGIGYDMWFVGRQRATIMDGKLAPVLDLLTLAREPHLYGVGPIAQLRGEVTIIDSRPGLGRVAPDGSVSVTESFAVGVPFFVWADIPRWKAAPIPPEVHSFEELERFIPKGAAAAGLDPARPLPFRISGRQTLIGFHLMHRVGDGPVNMETHQREKIHFELRQADVRIIGFHSTKHRGVFTPGDSNIHAHFQTQDNQKSGHIEKLILGPGTVIQFPSA